MDTPVTPALSDRRRYHRVDVRFPISTLLLGNALSGLSNFTTETLDLSEGGAKIRVPGELPMGLRVHLVVAIPGGVRYRCRALVLRSSPYPDQAGERGAWAAVQFIDPPPAMRSAIARLVATSTEPQSEGDG